MYCLDTNIIIDFFRGDKKIINLIHENDGYLYITPITLCELYRGVHSSKNPDHDISVIDNFLISVQMLQFNSIACKIYGHLCMQLKRKGRMMQNPDCMIASIVKARDLILITRNKKDFLNADIHVEEW